MRIPINVGVKGRVTATLTNTETGEKQEVKGNNLILNHYLDWAMERGLGILGDQTFNRCIIGNGTTPPQTTDTTFVGNQLALSDVSSLVGSVKQTDTKVDIVLQRDDLVISPTNSLAITPDKKIVFINSSTSLRAFALDVESWVLTELQVPDFSIIDYNLGYASGIACNGEYLVVSLSYANNGLLFKIEDDSVIYVGDIPGFTTNTAYLAFVPNSNRFVRVVAGLVYLHEIDVESGEVAVIASGGRSGTIVGVTVSPDYVSVGAYYYGSGSNRPWVGYIDLNTLEWKYHSLMGLGINNPPRAVMFVNPDTFYCLSGSSGWIKANYTFQWNIETLIPLPTSGIFRFEPFGSEGLFFTGNRMVNVIPGNNRAVTFSTIGLTAGSFSPEGPHDFNSIISFPSDRLIFGRLSQSPNGLVVYKVRENVTDRLSYSRQWTFPAGTGTGTVNRVGLQANSGTGANGNNRHVAQIVLPEAMEKTDLHQLDVIWEIEVENPGVWEGVIPGGSRDGSDLAWRVTINEEQFFALVSTGYSIPANWFGTTGTPNVRIGTSNEESDLIFDRENIRGEEIEYISSTAIREVNPYVPGSLKRTIRLFLEVDQGNGQIGEMVLGGSQSDNSLARITFDPPLDKPPHVGEGADPYRIYLDLEIGWQRGESDA